MGIRGRLLRMPDSDLLLRIMEIEAELKSMPKSTKENRYEIQPKRWSLVCEKRRLRIALASKGGYLTLTQEIKFINDRGGVCKVCGNNDSPTIDHIIPISKGGSNHPSNLQVLCGRCNSKKGDRING